MEKIKRIKLARKISLFDDPVLFRILSDSYGHKIKSIERVGEKKSSVCESWKIKFISHRPAFMKINFGADQKRILLQEKIFQSKIFKKNEGILPLWPTLNGRFVLPITGPSQTFNLTLTDYLENSRDLLRGGRNFGKEHFLKLARLLAMLHLRGRKLFSEILTFPARGDSRQLVLSHGDFTRENILLDKNKKIWLVDWENAKIDYPEYDLSYFVRDGRDAYGLKIDDPAHKLFFRAYEKYSGLKINYERLEQYLKSFKKI